MLEGLEERDFFAMPFDQAELEQLARRAGGIRNLFAFNSPSFKKLRRDPESVGDDELIQLVLVEPRLLRRPLLVTEDGRVLAGAKAVSQVE